ncbi:hypothetical protein SEA_ANNADREAMY_214 [Streptomyces phage Annadreamy]|uniref:Uncharacterized protein n=2 Tax=Annadreamyvirus annadreamy TaxID=2846392 RepID=A0A345GTM7_9CAUD|nr:hypothetical protein HWB75_gp064 [Streptomyces phage Annadreamy]AXG66299.1 hypothetical protein SEA_ANNADREAMY_214 [Streptomyces phage Annadreamy]QGH79522.1 hypothetical protein SEA_LIMPID_221 [Streptomyces phage Limpid]
MSRDRFKMDPLEELVYGCLGYILLVGIVFGALLVGAIWGLIEFFQWVF